MHNSITRNKVLLWTAAGLGMAAASFFVLTIRGDFPQLRARLAKVPILQSLISQRDQISAYSKLSTLDYSIPIFDALIETLEKPGTFNARRLRGYNGYIDYYEKVVELFPAMAEGYGLL